MTKRPKTPRLYPHLIVKDADRAISFYEEALGAEKLTRFADPNLGGHVVCAELVLGDFMFSLSEEARDWHNDAPTSLGGSPVVLHLQVEDADAAAARMVAAGARVVFPIADQFYGKREGRLADPFGHLWVLSQHLRDVSDAEIQREVDAYSQKNK